MLRSIDEMKNYVLEATDGEIGRCKDFLFDEIQMTVRYMVADTGKWLPGRKVLISPISLGEPDWTTRRFPVNLSRTDIKESPPLEADEPVSRVFEKHFYDFYGYPYYWVGHGVWGPEYYARRLYGVSPRELNQAHEEEQKDNHLRSVSEVEGYSIQALDGDIGHVEDFIVEDESWVFRYVVVDTRDLLPGGKKVLISPEWTATIRWAEKEFAVGMSREAVKQAPEYDPLQPVNREYEMTLYDFHGRPYYWE